MADTSTQARPYARAAFALAREDQTLDAWSAMLAESAGVIRHPRIRTLLGDPRLTASHKVDVLIDVLGDMLDEHRSNFLRVLSRKERLDALPEIAEQFEAERADYERLAVVDVVSAYALSQAQQDKLAGALERRLDRKITMTTSVDRTLLGGVVIHIGDTVIDGSVRGRLARLKRDLNA
ncbi:F0F1 ATP synthase subunit delta [Halomonas sp. HP20-15]|uniref:F0F1 ATP synthase subunit delta n=1 Tax=Halomonas sp. HP20-15 TaxID=3085901 RepID=UPI0029825E7F|nr:F0F1 ATP synthase subunit delta [Halomonas sp. HP20-15]MDW5375902.1 F0F1 ATP synthase subunit delta [Halomonas sp. HP20-15]